MLAIAVQKCTMSMAHQGPSIQNKNMPQEGGVKGRKDTNLGRSGKFLLNLSYLVSCAGWEFLVDESFQMTETYQGLPSSYSWRIKFQGGDAAPIWMPGVSMLKTLIESIMRLIPDLMPQDLSTIIWGILGPEKKRKKRQNCGSDWLRVWVMGHRNDQETY